MLLLKKCPSCGKRFSISAQGRKLVDDQIEHETTTSTVLMRTGSGRNAGSGNPMTTVVQVDMDRQTFETSYRCPKCGHSWVEKSTSVSKS
jgi:predicted RNA-binding Zn-ribbon protein involved in translation (DUF1610 family)